MQMKYIYHNLRWNYTSKKTKSINKTAFDNFFGL